MSRRFDDPEFVPLFVDGRTLRNANSLCNRPGRRKGEDHSGIRRSKNESTECVIVLLQGPQEHGFRPAGRLPLPDRGADSAVSAAKARKCYSRMHDPDFIADIKKFLSRRRIGKKENCLH